MAGSIPSTFVLYSMFPGAGYSSLADGSADGAHPDLEQGEMIQPFPTT